MTQTTNERQAYREQVVQRQGWSELNQLLATRRKLCDQMADLYQQMSRLRRKINDVDKEYSELVVKVEPSVSVSAEQPKAPTRKTESDQQRLEKAIRSAVSANPGMADRLQDLVDSL